MAVRIVLPIALERRLRAGEGGEVGTLILGLVDSARARTARDAPEPGPSWGEIVEIFRGVMGDKVFIPRSPHRVWIIRQMNRLKELGLHEQLEIRRLAEVGRQLFPRGAEVEYLIRNATLLLSRVPQFHATPSQSGEDRGNEASDGRDNGASVSGSGDVGEDPEGDGDADPRLFVGRDDEG